MDLRYLNMEESFFKKRIRLSDTYMHISLLWNYTPLKARHVTFSWSLNIMITRGENCFVRASLSSLGVFDFALVDASSYRICCLPTRLTVPGFWLKKKYFKPIPVLQVSSFRYSVVGE